MIEDIENVARAMFSPKMVIDGEIQPEAFRLRPSISENYLSVMRMTTAMPSHAGIFITVNGEDLIGGKNLEMPEPEMEQDFLLLAIQRELVDIAQKGLYII